jgi:hypothetical protein
LLKAQLLAEVHQRFVANCLRGLVAPLSTLWGLSCGLGGHGEDTRWLRNALEELLGGEEVAPSEAIGGAEAAEIAGLEAIVAVDGALLRVLKAVLRDGLQIFEAHGPATASRGAVVSSLIGRLLCVDRDSASVTSRARRKCYGERYGCSNARAALG